MIRRLIILLLIVGCGTEPEDVHPLVGEWEFIQRTFTFTLYSSPPSVCDGLESHVTTLTSSDYQETIILSSDNTMILSIGNDSTNLGWSFTENTFNLWAENDPSDIESYDYSISGNTLTFNEGTEQNCGTELTERTYAKQ